MQQTIPAADWITRVSAMAWTFAMWGASLDGCCDGGGEWTACGASTGGAAAAPLPGNGRESAWMDADAAQGPVTR